MSETGGWFDPLKRATVAFFRHDVRLRREGGAVKVVLLEPGADPNARPATPAERAADAARRELHAMRYSLQALMDSRPGTRRQVRHLALLERGLAREGATALERLPIEVLQPALDELEGLVTNWSDAPLACLRSKMAVAVSRRLAHEADTRASGLATRGSSLAADLADDTPPPRVSAFTPLPVAEVAPADDDHAAALLAAYAALGSADSPAEAPRRN
jgi:hypothetical protein